MKIELIQEYSPDLALGRPHNRIRLARSLPELAQLQYLVLAALAYFHLYPNFIFPHPEPVHQNSKALIEKEASSLANKYLLVENSLYIQRECR